MNAGYWYHLFVTAPLILTILFTSYVTLKYGSDKNLRSFSKNYKRFKLIFLLHRVYFICWTLSVLPAIMYAFGDRTLYVNIYSVSLACQPIGIVLCFFISWFTKRRQYFTTLTKKGVVQLLIEKDGADLAKLSKETEEDMDFKETIRKEIVEKISSSLDIIYGNIDSNKILKDEQFKKKSLDTKDEEPFEEYYFSDEEEDNPHPDVVASDQTDGRIGTAILHK